MNPRRARIVAHDGRVCRTARSSPAAFEQWAFGIGRSHRDRPGRMDMRRDSSVRSGGTALTMLSCSVTHIFVTCSNRTRYITTRLAGTYRCTRMHRSRAPCRSSVARWQCPFWADCTTNISEHEFPTGTGPRSRSLPRGPRPAWPTPPQVRAKRKRAATPGLAAGGRVRRVVFGRVPCAPSRTSMWSALQPGVNTRATIEIKNMRACSQVTAWPRRGQADRAIEPTKQSLRV
jgi:hypothetical protein